MGSTCACLNSDQAIQNKSIPVETNTKNYTPIQNPTADLTSTTLTTTTTATTSTSAGPHYQLKPKISGNKLRQQYDLTY